MTQLMDITFLLNGTEQQLRVPSQAMLLAVLRNEFGLTGVRGSCERSVCGACTVLINGEPVAACSVFAFEVDGKQLETIEGQSRNGELGPVQRAFVECGGFQCGYCTPGMIMLTTALLREDPAPTPEVAREWISSNICRCTGYQTIVEAVQCASELQAASEEVR